MNNNWLGLEGDVCVITGAVGGMGAEICREFAKQKANLVPSILMKPNAKIMPLN